MNRVRLVPLVLSVFSAVMAVPVGIMGAVEMRQFQELKASYHAFREADETLAYVCGRADGITETLVRDGHALTISPPNAECARIKSVAMARSI